MSWDTQNNAYNQGSYSEHNQYMDHSQYGDPGQYGGHGQYNQYNHNKVDDPSGFYNPNLYQPPANNQLNGQQPQPNSNAYGGHVGPSGMAPPGSAPGPAQFMVPGSQMLQDPMVTNLAMSYGRDFVGKGQEEIKKNIDKYVSISQLKYYFAVDTTYVSKKLGLLLFPFVHKDWSIRYHHEEPVQPRFELNAADLYIPSMAFVTYILVVGYMLGVQERFSPEILATTASGALTSLFLEIIIIYLTTTVMSITSTLAKWDFLAFSMYKYVGMIVCLVCGLFLSSSGYYASLLYTTLALALFLFRTLHLRVEPEVHGVENHGKRKIWLIMIMVVWQPLIMWWLTYSLVPTKTTTALPDSYAALQD